jgi:hypothetical protein
MNGNKPIGQMFMCRRGGPSELPGICHALTHDPDQCEVALALKLTHKDAAKECPWFGIKTGDRVSVDLMALLDALQYLRGYALPIPGTVEGEVVNKGNAEIYDAERWMHVFAHGHDRSESQPRERTVCPAPVDRTDSNGEGSGS